MANELAAPHKADEVRLENSCQSHCCQVASRQLATPYKGRAIDGKSAKKPAVPSPPTRTRGERRQVASTSDLTSPFGPDADTPPPLVYSPPSPRSFSGHAPLAAENGTGPAERRKADALRLSSRRERSGKVKTRRTLAEPARLVVGRIKDQWAATSARMFPAFELGADQCPALLRDRPEKGLRRDRSGLGGQRRSAQVDTDRTRSS